MPLDNLLQQIIKPRKLLFHRTPTTTPRTSQFILRRVVRQRLEKLRARNKAHDTHIARLEEELAAREAESATQGGGRVEDRIDLPEFDDLADPTAAREAEIIDFDQSGVVIEGDVDELPSAAAERL